MLRVGGINENESSRHQQSAHLVLHRYIPMTEEHVDSRDLDCVKGWLTTPVEQIRESFHLLGSVSFNQNLFQEAGTHSSNDNKESQ